ncbi:MAG: hypothetical protein G8345_19275 [Magnetococcales bacterium]|nr:SurA N-terminal domain-containing protein [Magnetococcales bacterium]NGZ29018.1 hypothetical protein [Magnetococcales bacterium]
MLNVLRRSATSWMVKAFLFLLALSFGVWGVGDYVQRQQDAPVAEVQGYGITQTEFANAYERDYNRLRQASGGGIDKKTAEAFGLKQQTLQRLVERHLLSMTGHELRLRATSEKIRESIATNPNFQRDGHFNMEQYNILLRNNRLSPQDYERQLSSDMTLAQLEAALRTVVSVPRPVVEILYRMFREKRTVSYLVLNQESLAGTLKPTNEILEKYLQEHATAFQTPARVKLKYVVFDADSVREGLTATPEEIKEYYEEHASDYQKEENRHARHILIRVGEGKDGEAQAQARINAIQDRLSRGEDFAKVAKETSEDTTASEGGDLGFFGRGIMVKPFEDVVFAMQPGQVSKPVRTDFGFHLIRLEAVQTGETKSLAEVTPEVTTRVIHRKAQELVYDRSAHLEDQLIAHNDLATLAKDFNLRYRETDFIARGDSKLEGVERNPKFIETAFATTVGENSHLLEIGEAVFASLQVVAKEEPRAQTLVEAKQAVEKAYIQDETARLAKERLEEAMKAIQGGATWESQIKGQIRQESDQSFTFAERESKVPAQIRDFAFTLSLDKPVAGKILEENGTFYLVKLQKIEEAPMEGLAKEEENISRQVERGLSTEQVGAFLTDLKMTSRITVNQTMLDRF